MRVLVRLVFFVKRHWTLLLLAFICLVATTALSLVVPYMLGTAIDSTLESGERSFLWLAAGVILGVAILRGASGFGHTFLSQLVSQRTSYDIRNAIYDKLQQLSFAYHDQSQTGELMSRATVDVEAIRMFFGNGLLSLVQTVIMLVGVAYLLLSQNWQLALVSLAFMPVIAWRAMHVSIRIRPMWLRVQELIAALGTTLEESLTGVRVVKAFARQKDEGQKFSGDATTLYNQQIDIARQMAFNMPLMVFLLSIPMVLVLWYGGRQVIAESLTIGGLTMFILYLGMLTMPIRRLGFLATMLSRTVSAGERIIEILDTESAVQEKPNAIKLDGVTGAVSFEDVSFSYDSSTPALEDINFSVRPGETVALLGGSGSGKTTIASLLSRFYDITSGRITVDGVDIRDVTLDSLRKNVVTSQQDIFLFSTTIQDNIAYGAVNADMEQIVAVAKAAHLDEFVQSLPDGYDTWVGERGITLSGGERQRLAIARTLLLNPRVLILDDSTSSVDAETEHLIRQALDKLIEGRTTFVITHRLPIIKNADLILVLEKGQIVERGKHNELMAKKGLYYQTYQAQLAATQSPGDNSTEE